MKREPSEVEIQLPPHGTPPRPQAGSGACLVCRKPTSRAALSKFGARCFACYQAYCNKQIGDVS